MCSELHIDTDFEIYGSSIWVSNIHYFVPMVGMRKGRVKNNAKMKKKERKNERKKERKKDRQK